MAMKRQLALLVTSFIPFAIAKSAGEPAPLRPAFAAGQTYSNVFSIQRSIRADGYDEWTDRDGGSADYTVLAATPERWRFQLLYRYDGNPGKKREMEFREGGRTQCLLGPEGKESCKPYTEGSGLAFNPGVWGTPPSHLAPGVSWTVKLRSAWELGGPNGTEKVTVVSVDPTTNTVVLLRDGTASGPYAGESGQTQLTHQGKVETFDKIPGVAHWRGYATFAKGVVFADSLLVTRDLTLKDQSGKLVHAVEREIMLLNAAPYPTL
jgi:hypothetical protein